MRSEPLPMFDRRTTPHPVASVLQRISLRGDLSRFKRKDYVYATEWGGAESPFRGAYERAAQDPSFRVHALETRHNVMRDVPDQILRILVEA
ncbi:hypothetical protein [Kitasatospora sp. LaBMicrA B282]|uniref:hypothetical protein n=1 Tax=Kitasatospora sp. LaBMicrA B282 TaxID=3420949 RepID=UPI003D14E95B